MLLSGVKDTRYAGCQFLYRHKYNLRFNVNLTQILTVKFMK
jgi:hypothetical protein